MLTLFHGPRSRSSRVLWLLEELGAEYSVRYTNIPRQDGSGAADPDNPHPDKKVPALVHDGVLVTESVAIVLYLTDLFPDAGLAPKVGDPLRGPYLSWLAYYAGVMEPVLAAAFAGVGDHPVFAATFRTRAEVDKRVLGALDKGPYLLGDTFSAADIVLASAGLFMRGLLPAGERVDAYLKTAAERPARQRAVAKEEPS